MPDQLMARLRAIGDLIAQPTSNLAASLLLLAALAVLLLIVITVTAMFLVPSRDEEDEYADEKQPPVKPEQTPRAHERAGTRTRAKLGLLTYAAVIALVLIGIGVSYVGSSSNGYCASCHPKIAAAEATIAETKTDAEASGTITPVMRAHATARCVSCHEDNQITGVFANSGTRLRHLVKKYFGGSAVIRPQPIPASRCLSCHADVTEKSTASQTKQLRMSHREPVEAGMSCLDCHSGLGHDETAVVGKTGMSVCLQCHDDKKAPAKCTTCHTADVGYSTLDSRVFAPVNLPPVYQCGGCHDQKKCDACHGLRMPHPADFVAGEHARYAGFEKKKMCYRCHTMTDCSKCHQTKDFSLGYWGHFDGKTWKYLHGHITPPGSVAGCGCHGRSKYAMAGNYCKACH